MFEKSLSPLPYKNDILQSSKRNSHDFESEYDFELEETEILSPLTQSLIKLFSLLGKPINSEIFLLSNTDLKPSACLKIIRENGFEGNIFKREHIKEISSLVLPCILFLKNKNSCVFLKRVEEVCTVFIPNHGIQIIEALKLEEEYTGYALFARKLTKEDQRVSSLKFINEKYWFWSVIWHYLPIYKHILFASILINIIGIASSLFAMNVYDRVVPNKALETLWGLSIGVTIAYIADFILKSSRTYFVDIAGRNADVLLSSKLIARILNIRYADKPESTGVLANNIREFEHLREFFSSSTLIAFIDLPFLVLFLFLLASIGGSLVFIPLCAIPLLLLSSYILQKYATHSIEQNFKQNMHKNAFLIEILNGLETIKCCNAEKNIQENWDNIVSLSALASSKTRTLSSFTSILSSSITQFVSLAVIILGVYLIADNKLTMGGLIASNILTGRAMAPLMQISSLLTRFQQSRMTLKTLDLLMNIPLENKKEDFTSVFSNNLNKSLSKTKAKNEEISSILELEHTKDFNIYVDQIKFNYPNASQECLNNITFSLKQGEKIGIIGRMGSGKSTLAKLLIGLYEVSQGNIFINNVDLRNIHTQELRKYIGFLPQDIVLFYGSVKENIALSNTHLDPQIIKEVAELAGVTDFLKNYPAGFETQVGERGMNFSGGQRQAIALARTLVHKPKILIFDEPSSNMDTQSEEILKKRIDKSIQNSSLILITHRLSMLDLVDRIILLEQGSIVFDLPKHEAFKRLAQAKA